MQIALTEEQIEAYQRIAAHQAAGVVPTWEDVQAFYFPNIEDDNREVHLISAPKNPMDLLTAIEFSPRTKHVTLHQWTRKGHEKVAFNGPNSLVLKALLDDHVARWERGE